MSRQKNKRALKESYAIITEDSVSSPNYIRGLIKHLSGDVKEFKFVYRGASPKTIKEWVADNKEKYSYIFCVFDKDNHDEEGNHFTNLRHYCKNSGHTIDASSVPCFEYWLYLHFEYLDKTIYPKGEETASKVMQRMLKDKHLLNYQKGILNFDDFKDRLETAKLNAKKSINRYEQDGNDNPVTYMGGFVEKLEEIINPSPSKD